MVQQARSARILAATLASTGEDRSTWRGRVVAALMDRAVADRLMADRAAVAADPAARPRRLIVARGAAGLVARGREIAATIGDLASERGSRREPRPLVYHSRRGAARTATRIFLSVLASSSLPVAAGLPSSSTALVYVCLVYVCLASGLGAIRPNP